MPPSWPFTLRTFSRRSAACARQPDAHFVSSMHGQMISVRSGQWLSVAEHFMRRPSPTAEQSAATQSTRCRRMRGRRSTPQRILGISADVSFACRLQVHAYPHLVHLLFEPQDRRRGVYRVAPMTMSVSTVLLPSRRPGRKSTELNPQGAVRRNPCTGRSRITKRPVHRMRERVDDWSCPFTATTMPDPRWAFKSSRSAASHACAPAGSGPPRRAPATPISAASARASSSTWLRFNGRR